MKTDNYYQFNLFLFVANMTQWHFCCRKSFNDTWRKAPTPLSPTESRLLAQLKDVLLKFEHKYHRHLAEALLEANMAVRSLKVQIAPSQAEIIEQCLTQFKPRFDYFYNLQEKNIAKVGEYLHRLMSEHQDLLAQNRILYPPHNYKKLEFIVTLSQDAHKSAGGICYEGKERSYIVMQFGDYDLSRDTAPMVDILMHEIGHTFQASSQWIELIRESALSVSLVQDYVHEGVRCEDVVNELIQTALWGPSGLLSQQLHTGSLAHNSKRKQYLLASPRSYYVQIELCAMKIHPLIERRIKQRKSLSKVDILAIISAWNQSVLEYSKL